MKCLGRFGLKDAGIVLAAAFLAQPLVGQSAAEQRTGPFERYGGVADRFNVRGGLLFASHSTLARVDSEELGVGTLVDLEDDLGLESTTRNGRVDAYVRLGRRHQLRLGYVSLRRASDIRLQRQIQWGDEVFSVDAAVSSRADLTLVPASYRFSLVKSERIDLGLSAGVFASFVDASIDAPELGIAEAESADFPLPVLGADVDIALAPRVFVLGGFEYFALSVEGVDGSWSEIRGAVEVYPHRNLGFGAGYRSVSLDVDGTGSLEGAGSGTEIFFDYGFEGPQIYATISL